MSSHDNFAIKKLDAAWKKAVDSGNILILLSRNRNLDFVEGFFKKKGINILSYRCEEGEKYVPLSSIMRFSLVNTPGALGSRVNEYNNFFRKVRGELDRKTPAIVLIREVQYADILSIRFLSYLSANPVKNLLLIISYPPDTETQSLKDEIEKLFLGDRADVLLLPDTSEEEFRSYLNMEKINMLGIPEDFQHWDNLLVKMLHNCRKDDMIKKKEDLFQCILENSSEMERKIIFAGSVMGNFFWRGIIQQMGFGNDNAIKRLIEKNIIKEFRSTSMKMEISGYIFTSAEFRDYVYAHIPVDTRIKLHEEIGKIVEKSKYSMPWEKTFTLAHHFTNGKHKDRAIPYLEKSAKKCIVLHDYWSSVYYLRNLEKFLNSKDDETKRLELYEGMANAHMSAGNFDESSLYAEKLKLMGMLKEAKINGEFGNYQQSRVLCKRIIKSGDEYLQMVAYGILGDVERKMGLYKSAINHEKKHIELAEMMENKREMAKGYKYMGNLHLVLGNYEVAERYYLKSLNIFRELRDKHGMASVYNNMGVLNRRRKNLSKALEYYRKGLKLYEFINDYDGVGSIYNNLGLIYKEKGAYLKALESFRKSVEYNLLVGYYDGANYAYSNMCLVYMETGNFKESKLYAEKMIEIAEKSGGVRFKITGYGYLSGIYYFSKRYDEAIKEAKKAIEFAEKSGEYIDASDAYYYLALSELRLHDEQGCIETSRNAMKKIKDKKDSLGDFALLRVICNDMHLEDAKNYLNMKNEEDRVAFEMTKALIMAKNGKNPDLNPVIGKLKKQHRLSILVDFIERYSEIAKDMRYMEVVESIKKDFQYPG